jgi:hypothetical protein
MLFKTTRDLSIAIGLLLATTITATAQTLPYEDADFQCIDAAKANKYINDFNIKVSGFGGNELCNSKVDTKKLYNDLEIVEAGQFQGNDTNVFIKNFVPANDYYNWLKRMTRSVNRGHDVPWATAYNSGGNFTMQDGWALMSTLGRVGTIIHEARHTAGYYHRACTNGPYSNTRLSGCDTSVEQGGSHGVEMEYYSRVALQGVNFHPAYKSMARLMNIGRSNFVFNTLPMQKREVLLALENQRVLVLDKEETLEVAAPQTTDMILKRSSFGASLYLGSSAYAVDLYSPEETSPLLKDEYSYYKLLLDKGAPKAIDTEEFDVGTLRYFVVLDGQQKVYSYLFAQGKWSNPVTIPGATQFVTVTPDGRKGLFVLKDTGKICQFQPDRMACGQDLDIFWPEHVQSYALFNNDLVELHSDGMVYKSSDKSILSPLNGMKIHQIVGAPIYNVFGY